MGQAFLVPVHVRHCSMGACEIVCLAACVWAPEDNVMVFTCGGVRQVLAKKVFTIQASGLTLALLPILRVGLWFASGSGRQRQQAWQQVTTSQTNHGIEQRQQTTAANNRQRQHTTDATKRTQQHVAAATMTANDGSKQRQQTTEARKKHDEY